MKAANPSPTLNAIQLKSVALPSEHGGWGFLIEPILLGLFVAGSTSGLILSAAMLSAFLIHQPLKLTLKDRSKGRHLPRTVWAERFVAGYSLIAIVLLGVVGFKSDPLFVAPLLLALPFLLIQVNFDARNQSRALLPELCGAVALGSTASAVAILGGWTLSAALPLWLIVSSRSIPSILYVRARLKLEHGKPSRPYPAWIAHGVACFILTVMAAAQAIPAIVPGAYALLLVRALVGLSKYRQPRPAKQIGLLELVYGLLTVALTAIGYAI